jgi:hypothetical protein
MEFKDIKPAIARQKVMFEGREFDVMGIAYEYRQPIPWLELRDAR